MQFKGGPWTNKEDEVLKAALSGYTLHHWSKVASLLTNKTAQQCQERWEKYLDPRLIPYDVSGKDMGASTWTAEEDEAIVKLQLTYPHQWQLIATEVTRLNAKRNERDNQLKRPYIRADWMCEARFLDLQSQLEYENKQRQEKEKEGSGASASGAETGKQSLLEFIAQRRRQQLRLGHEALPARSDERVNNTNSEMLDMAVSRFANQDQKKGLRKEREAKLEEAKFLAQLENRRENIETGILSNKEQRRISRAMEEDRLTRGSKRPREDGGSSDEDDDDDEGEDEEGDDGFQPVDALALELAAGTARKKRKLFLHDGSGSATNDGKQKNSTTSLGIQASLLDQITSGKANAVADVAALEEKKKSDALLALLSSEEKASEPSSSRAEGKTPKQTAASAAGANSADVFSTLFGSLPPVDESVASTSKKSVTSASKAVAEGAVKAKPTVAAKSNSEKSNALDDLLSSLPVAVAAPSPAEVAVLSTVPSVAPAAPSRALLASVESIASVDRNSKFFRRAQKLVEKEMQRHYFKVTGSQEGDEDEILPETEIEQAQALVDEVTLLLFPTSITPSLHQEQRQQTSLHVQTTTALASLQATVSTARAAELHLQAQILVPLARKAAACFLPSPSAFTEGERGLLADAPGGPTSFIPALVAQLERHEAKSRQRQLAGQPQHEYEGEEEDRSLRTPPTQSLTQTDASSDDDTRAAIQLSITILTILAQYWTERAERQRRAVDYALELRRSECVRWEAELADLESLRRSLSDKEEVLQELYKQHRVSIL